MKRILSFLIAGALSVTALGDTVNTNTPTTDTVATMISTGTSQAALTSGTDFQSFFAGQAADGSWLPFSDPTNLITALSGNYAALSDVSSAIGSYDSTLQSILGDAANRTWLVTANTSQDFADWVIAGYAGVATAAQGALADTALQDPTQFYPAGNPDGYLSESTLWSTLGNSINVILGINNTTEGANNVFAIGAGNTLVSYAAAFGWYNTLTSYGYALGDSNNLTAYGLVIGLNVTLSTENTVEIGKGDTHKMQFSGSSANVIGGLTVDSDPVVTAGQVSPSALVAGNAAMSDSAAGIVPGAYCTPDTRAPLDGTTPAGWIRICVDPVSGETAWIPYFK